MCSLWLLGILVYTTSVGNIGQVYCGKFVVGIGLGQMSVIAPAYVAVSVPVVTSLSIQSCLTDFHDLGMCSFAKQRYVQPGGHTISACITAFASSKPAAL
jgi:hypothetical protein